MITLTGPLKLWRWNEGSAHFMSVPEDLTDEIRLHAMEFPRGFSSVRVECRLHDVTWRTSVFPVKEGGYFLPVKMQVVRKAGIAEGDEVTVMLTLI